MIKQNDDYLNLYLTVLNLLIIKDSLVVPNFCTWIP